MLLLNVTFKIILWFETKNCNKMGFWELLLPKSCLFTINTDDLFFFVGLLMLLASQKEQLKWLNK
jgi:hypothetical protein